MEVCIQYSTQLAHSLHHIEELLSWTKLDKDIRIANLTDLPGSDSGEKEICCSSPHNGRQNDVHQREDFDGLLGSYLEKKQVFSDRKIKSRMGYYFKKQA